MTNYILYPVIATPLVIYMTGMFACVMESLWTFGLSAPEERRGETHYKYRLFTYRLLQQAQKNIQSDDRVIDYLYTYQRAVIELWC